MIRDHGAPVQAVVGVEEGDFKVLVRKLRAIVESAPKAEKHPVINLLYRQNPDVRLAEN
jgi:hypothetical protein